MEGGGIPPKRMFFLSFLLKSKIFNWVIKLFPPQVPLEASMGVAASYKLSSMQGDSHIELFLTQVPKVFNIISYSLTQHLWEFY